MYTNHHFHYARKIRGNNMRHQTLEIETDNDPENKSNLPEFTTLIYDNAKTTGEPCGKVGGLILGATVAFGSGSVGNPEAGFKAGVWLGDKIFSTLGGIIFSVPFAVASKLTRQFIQSNEDIDPYVNYFHRHINDKEKLYLVQEIVLKHSANLSWLASYDSDKLLEKLVDPLLETDKKWEAVVEYMNEKSNSGAYVHNGKNVFNTILATFILTKFEMQLYIHMQKKDDSAASMLINNNFSLLSEVDSSGMNTLHRAAVSNKLEIVKLLYSLGVKLDTPVISSNDQGKTALFLAAENGATEVVMQLIKLGANASIGEMKFHPVHIAAQKGHFETVQTLVNKYQGLIEIKDNFGQTPLLWAAWGGHEDIVKFLASCGANINAFTLTSTSTHKNHKKYAYQWAWENRHYAVAKFLLNNDAHENCINRIRHNLKKLILAINKDNWNKEGLGIFSNHLPPSVILVRGFFEKNNLEVDLIDKITPYSIFTISVTLKKMEFPSNAMNLRSNKTSLLINIVHGIDEKRDNDLNTLAQFDDNEIELMSFEKKL